MLFLTQTHRVCLSCSQSTVHQNLAKCFGESVSVSLYILGRSEIKDFIQNKGGQAETFAQLGLLHG